MRHCLLLPAALTLIAATLAVSAPSQAPAAATPADAMHIGVPVPKGAVAILNGQTVSEDVFIEECAQRFTRANSPGLKSLEALITQTLVASAADKRGLTVTADDVTREMERIDALMRQADPKKSLEAAMRERKVPRETFLAALAQSLKLQKLAREDQKLPAGQEVPTDNQNVWLANRRKEAVIVTDAAKLPRGTVATVDGVPIPAREFVAAALVTADKQPVLQIIDMLMQELLVDMLLAADKCPLKDADLDAEFAELKDAWDKNPKYKGIVYEDALRDQKGMDAPAFRRSRGFRVTAGVAKLGQKHFSRSDLDVWYRANTGRFGPTYTVRHLLIEGSDAPEKSGRPNLPPLAKAHQQVEALAKLVAEGKPFEDLIRQYSEDTGTKYKGGLIEPFAPSTTHLVKPFVDAVEKLEPGVLSPPVDTQYGCHLIMVVTKEPAPPLDKVEAEVRRQNAVAWFRTQFEKSARGIDVRL